MVKPLCSRHGEERPFYIYPMDAFVNYYDVLGVDVDASNGTIKTAFKKLAHQYHPDVYKGDDANERMRLLVQAYKTLNDPVARQQYDAVLSEHSPGVHTPRVNMQNVQGKRGASVRTRTSARDVSPSARRDRQRYYDFPDVREGQPLHIDLIDMQYDLSAEQALVLRKQGLLRGGAPQSDAATYYCHRCHHHWSTTATQMVGMSRTGGLPYTCPKCHASDWAEYLLLRCVHCCAILESEQIRYEIGVYRYGNGRQGDAAGLCPPYELFPLCPYCGAAHWCPTEDVRVDDLRQQAVRRAAFLRMVWLSVIVVVLILLGVIALGMLR